MTPEQINIAIAESLGWKYIQVCDSWSKNKGAMQSIPNYHGSLDACVEFEKALTRPQKSGYCKELHAFDCFGLFTTAPQRCKAYLKTIGKWEES